MTEIPVGDAVRKLKLPRWLRWLLDVLRGVRIRSGDTTIVLSQDTTAQPNRLDQPHKFEPPKVGGHR